MAKVSTVVLKYVSISLSLLLSHLLQVSISPEVGEAWIRVLSEESKSNWVIAGYTGDDTKTVVVGS